MRVVNGAKIQAVVLDGAENPVEVVRIDVVAERTRLGVPRAVHGDGLAVPRGDHAAALVGRVRARVGDDLVEQLARDAHAARRYQGPGRPRGTRGESGRGAGGTRGESAAGPGVPAAS